MSDLWNKTKGKIAIAGMLFLFGVPAIATFTGVEVVEGGPEGAICLAIAKVE